jgi:hypothetical protein
VEASNPLKTGTFGVAPNYSAWPKVADVVIEAPFCLDQALLVGFQAVLPDDYSQRLQGAMTTQTVYA